MFEESSVGSALSRKATLLMAELLQKANRVLPLSVAAKIQVEQLVYVPYYPGSYGMRMLGSTSCLQAGVRL